MKLILLVLELIIAIGLIGSILIQAKGTGLSASFGGGGEFYQSRRGVEKIVTYLTVGLTILFAVISLALLIIP